MAAPAVPTPHSDNLRRILESSPKGRAPSCDTFPALAASRLTAFVAKAATEQLLPRSGELLTASARENAIERIANILLCIAEPRTSLASQDSSILGQYRERNGLFRGGARFFERTLPGLRSRLRCLEYQDYVLVRNLRRTFEELDAEGQQEIVDLVYKSIQWAQKGNPGILNNTVARFFPGYDGTDTGRRNMSLEQFFTQLEEETYQHVELNPLYPNVAWSSARDMPEPNEDDVRTAFAHLRGNGFVMIRDFGHTDNAEHIITEMLRSDSAKGIGTFPNEALYISSQTDDITRKIFESGLGPMFVKVCQECFLDPRIARIVLTRAKDDLRHGVDIIFDEIAIAEVTPEQNAHPLCLYKVGKLGTGREHSFKSMLSLDSVNYPSYAVLSGLVPNPGDTKLFINTDAPGDEIDFGIALRGSDEKVYIVTANDTKRTALQVIHILGPDLFAQSMSAIQTNVASMFTKLLKGVEATAGMIQKRGKGARE